MDRREALKVAAIAGIAAGFSTQAMAADLVDKSKFNRKKLGFADPKKPTEFELKHTPAIVIKEKDAQGFTQVDVIIGQQGVIHPSVDNHWIDFIELYANEKLVGKLELMPNAGAFATFKVKMDGVKTLRAVEGCNLHGIWESTLNV